MKYRKKPIIIEAIQWTGDNYQEINSFCPTARYPSSERVRIDTLEGQMTAEINDWIIREPFPTGDRRFYPCKDSIFKETYEKV